MRAVVWDIEYTSSEDVFPIYPIADVHLGHVGCAEDLLSKRIDEIASNPKARWFGVGDMMDCIGRNVGDPRSDESILAPWLHGEVDIFPLQRKRLIKMLRPIAWQCLAYGVGNHELTVARHHGVEMYHSVIEGMVSNEDQAVALRKKLCVGYSGFVKIQFRRVKPGQDTSNRRERGPRSTPLVIYLNHGWGGSSRSGSNVNKLQDLPGKFEADLYALAHVHDQNMLRKSRQQVTQSGNIIERTWAGVHTGTWLRNYILDDSDRVNYPELHGAAPSTIGGPIIHVRPEESERFIQILW